MEILSGRPVWWVAQILIFNMAEWRVNSGVGLKLTLFKVKSIGRERGSKIISMLIKVRSQSWVPGRGRGSELTLDKVRILDRFFSLPTMLSSQIVTSGDWWTPKHNSFWTTHSPAHIVKYYDALCHIQRKSHTSQQCIFRFVCLHYVFDSNVPVNTVRTKK